MVSPPSPTFVLLHPPTPGAAQVPLGRPVMGAGPMQPQGCHWAGRGRRIPRDVGLPDRAGLQTSPGEASGLNAAGPGALALP